MVGSRVYVGGLPYGVRERDLERFFKGYGRTKDILIKNGYGFVEFEDHRDADDAVYELNGKELQGQRVSVEPARGQARVSRRDRYDGDRYGGRGRGGGGYNDGSSSKYYGPAFSTEFRLIVKNLSSRVNWKDLKDYMRQAGEVTYADAHKHRRNEGVVEFASASDMKNAIQKLDDTELNGRRVRLVEDVSGGRDNVAGRSGHSRRSSGSRSRSRSRKRNRSHSRKRSRSRSHRRSRSRSSGSRSTSRSRSKSHGGNRSKSKSPVKNSRSRSRSDRRDSKSRSRSLKRNSRSRSRSLKRSSRSRSRSLKINSRSSRSKSKDRSRDRSVSKSKDRESKSLSPKNNGGSASRRESMEE